MTQSLTQRLDAILDQALAEQRLAGGVLLVTRDGQRAYGRAAGLADREAGRPMAEDAIFRLSSLTKPMITAAALSLVESGVISLDDPVTRWLPDFRPAFEGQTPTITLRQLLTHTAGLSYGFMQPHDGPYLRERVSDGMDQPGLSMAEELKRVEAAGLGFPPGAAWLYSVGLDVLGAALEKAAGKSLPRIFTERVGGPLGMADTGYTVTDPKRLAVPYADGPPPRPMGEACTVPFIPGASGLKFAPGRAFDATSFPSGGAGMVGTAGEFMTFLEAIRTGGGGIVSGDSARAMMANQTGDRAIVTNGPGWGFGFGGAVLLDPAAANSVHSKGVWLWGGVYGHSWFVDPERKLSVALLTNSSIEGMTGQLTVDVTAAIQADR